MHGKPAGLGAADTGDPVHDSGGNGFTDLEEFGHTAEEKENTLREWFNANKKAIERAEAIKAQERRREVREGKRRS